MKKCLIMVQVAFFSASIGAQGLPVAPKARSVYELNCSLRAGLNDKREILDDVKNEIIDLNDVTTDIKHDMDVDGVKAAFTANRHNESNQLRSKFSLVMADGSTKGVSADFPLTDGGGGSYTLGSSTFSIPTNTNGVRIIAISAHCDYKETVKPAP
jgi:hypothetical protein